MGEVKDRILGYGMTADSLWKEERYLEADGEMIRTDEEGWLITHQLPFDVPASITKATLHIPYLAMARDENLGLKLKLPNDYGTSPCDYELLCSLRKIKITEIERTVDEYEPDTKDKIMLHIEFENNDENYRLYSFAITDFDSGYARHSNYETGCTEYIELIIDKRTRKINAKITSLLYYLMGEYEMELNLG